MSPDIHNASFKALGIKARYESIRISKENLLEGVRTLTDKGFKGFNVTIPHKVEMVQIVDEIDPLAKKIGAINTVGVENGKLIGYNTDGPGFLKGLQQFYKQDLLKANVLIIGAGGAARAIVMTLVSNGVSRLTVANRTIEKASNLFVNCEQKGQALTINEAEACLEQFDLIINTTPIGMEPNKDKMPILLENAKQKTYVCDIIYNPLQTNLLTKALEKGCHVQNGVPMFVYQAAMSFEYWTGRKPDLEKMTEIVNTRLLQK
ncbi:shikimate dehydrogenase [Alkalihalobacillus sp. AL-G]|nr:shikimate dehydrogenase [Alkalihalobacillus sp. AL-G]